MFQHSCRPTANLRTNIMDFRGFDSSIILIIRGGIPRSIGNFLESLSQAMLVGVMLVGRSGVTPAFVQHTETMLAIITIISSSSSSSR